MTPDKEDLSTLWHYAQSELTCTLLLKVIETESEDLVYEKQKKKVGSGESQHRILLALEAYKDKITELYAEWKGKNPDGVVWNFIFSPYCPRFRLPELRGGSRKFTANSDSQRTVDEYERCHQQLKKTLKKPYRNPAARKRTIHSTLKTALGVEFIPETYLKDWQLLRPAEIALRAVAWHTKQKQHYLKKKISKAKQVSSKPVKSSF